MWIAKAERVAQFMNMIILAIVIKKKGNTDFITWVYLHDLVNMKSDMLSKIYLATVVIMSILISETGGTTTNVSLYADCPDDLLVLQKALYGMKGNKNNLTKTFYPPRKQPTGFVRVNYYFEDEIGEKDEDCFATFLWASGGFLLIQPPSVFRFTSLLFDNKVDDITSVNLTLPYECRPLTVEPNCTCKNSLDDDDLLDLLTQQVFYFKTG